MKKILLPILCLLLLCVLGTAYADSEPIKADVSGQLFQFGGSPDIGDVSAAALQDSEAAKFLYQQLYKEATEIDMSKYSLTPDALFALVTDTTNNHGDLFYFTGWYHYYTNSSGYVTKLVDVEYMYTPSERAAKRAQLEKAVSAAISYASAGSTPLLKAMLVNDYFCANFDYDYTYSSYDAYSLMVEGKAVCQGYMEAYSLVMSRLGIPCTYAESDPMDHTWNLIQLGGKWYHVDVTWNDTGDVWHKYFLRSDSGIPKHYDWVSEVSAVSTTYDNAFWIEISSNIPVSGIYAYYIQSQPSNDHEVRQWNSSANTHTTLNIFTAVWVVGSNYNFSMSAPYYPGEYFGTLTLYNNTLYFVVPSGVRSVSVNGGSSQQVLTIPNGNGSIYRSAFVGTTLHYQTGLNYNDVNVNNNPTGSGTWTIPGSAPQYTIPDKLLILPADLEKIEDSAFENSNVEYVVGSGSLTAIGSKAFASCKKLTLIELSRSVQSIADDAFAGCSSELVFLCMKDSYAWTYAEAHGFTPVEKN